MESTTPFDDRRHWSQDKTISKYEALVSMIGELKKTRVDTGLPQLRAGEQGPLRTNRGTKQGVETHRKQLKRRIVKKVIY